jgi:glycogen operon protein
MLLGGDEFGRTQEGNNNAWCQDNEISWYGWDRDEWQHRLQAFTQRLIALRREHPVFRRTHFLVGREQQGSGLPDVWWFRADGRRMTQRDWADGAVRTLGVFLNGSEITETTRDGQPIVDDTFLLLFNAHHEEVQMRLPTASFGREWTLELSTLDPELEPGAERHQARAIVAVVARSLLLLRRVTPRPTRGRGTNETNTG